MPSRHFAPDTTTNVKNRKPRTSFSVAIKLEVVKKMETGKYKVSQLLQEYGVSCSSSLHIWKKQKELLEEMVANGYGHLKIMSSYDNTKDETKRQRDESTEEKILFNIVRQSVVRYL